MNERMKYITYLRVFAMISVVLGHTATYNSSWGIPLYKIIFAYHIPLFVFISGFCFKISATKKSPRIIKPLVVKFKNLVLPAFIVSLLVVLPTELFATRETPLSCIGERILLILQGRVSHLWFLLMLFWIFVFFCTD